MTRTAASSLDRDLLAQLADRGITVTRSSLERWRRVGLIPRPRQTWSGGGGSRTSFDQPLDAVVDHVAAVARRSRRGHPAQLVAVAVTADGYVVDEQLLRTGLRMSLTAAAAIFAGPANVARARRVTAPIDELDDAEQTAEVIVDDRAGTARWRRNLRANRDLVASDGVDAVLRSATTAMVELINGGQPSQQAIEELTAAIGIRAFATTLATEGNDDGLDREDVTAAVANLLGPLFNGTPVLARLNAALDAPGPVLAAASRLVVGLWTVVDGLGALGPGVKIFPAPTGDDPHMHAIGVAWLLEHLRSSPFDLAPILDVGKALSLIDEPTARLMNEAAATLHGWRGQAESYRARPERDDLGIRG